MDELMVRFMHNIHRTEHQKDYNEAKKILEQDDLLHESDKCVKQGVEKSF